MNQRFWLRLALQGAFIAILLAGCQATPEVPPTASPTETASVTAPTSTPAATPTPLPNAQGVAQAYFDAWQQGDYGAMYALLAPASQAEFSAPDFEQQYRHNLSIMSAAAYTATLGTMTENGDRAEAPANLVYDTLLSGRVVTEVTLALERRDGRWGVLFSPAIIWPELVDGNQLYMVPFVPDRGVIYDRAGVPMASKTEAYAIGLVPGDIEDEGQVQTGLGRLLGVPAPNIRARYEFEQADQYLAMGEVSAATLASNSWVLNVAGVRNTPYTARYYPGNGAAAHITGYTVFIQADRMAEYQALGYSPDQRIGETGLERWGEEALAGRNGGQLTLLDAAGQPLRAIAFGSSTPSQDIHTTIDFSLQQAAQFALGDYTGAIVVLDVATGEVLAMASNPTYNPNLLEPANLNRQFADFSTFDTLNRAAQDAFPAGSIFKIVTMAAGMTSGLFAPDSVYTCTGTWEEIGPSHVLYDWLEGGHGAINLMQGLAGSCNPWFWHIGKALFDYNPSYLSEIARAFGLGRPTGIAQIDESPGRIPDPAWTLANRGQAWEVVDSLNLAIGQGDVLVTPLQIAQMVAAVGNSGTLMQPQLVRSIQAPDSEPSFEFRPIVAGQLPLNQEQLSALQQAMDNVTREPLGTARNRFRGMSIPIAAKTGTAETGVPDPHAWFAGYTFANRAGKPDIAIAVWVSNRGQGSDIAAPIFRRVVESYFGLGLTRYPWEESAGVVATPEPSPTPGGPDEESTPSPP